MRRMSYKMSQNKMTKNPLLIPVPVPTQAMFSLSGKPHCSVALSPCHLSLPSSLSPFSFLFLFLLLASFYFLLPPSLYSLSFFLCPHALFPWLEREGTENSCSRIWFFMTRYNLCTPKDCSIVLFYRWHKLPHKPLLWTCISTKIRMLKPQYSMYCLFIGETFGR